MSYRLVSADNGAARPPVAGADDGAARPRKAGVDDGSSANGARPAGGGSATLGAFEQTRPMVAAQALGIGRAALEFACDWAAKREAFGGPILDKQGVSFPLADLAADLDAARLLTWRASWMAAQNAPYHHAEGSMSKLKASEVAVRITEQAIKVAGGLGIHPRPPGREVVSRRQAVHDLRGHVRDPAARDRPHAGRRDDRAAAAPPDAHGRRRHRPALGRGTKRRSLAAGAAMRAAQKTPPALLKPAMRILGPPQKPRG